MSDESVISPSSAPTASSLVNRKTTIKIINEPLPLKTTIASGQEQIPISTETTSTTIEIVPPEHPKSQLLSPVPDPVGASSSATRISPPISSPSKINLEGQVQQKQLQFGSQNIVNFQNQKMQEVRVDNWGNYCLQRLAFLYNQGSFCDLTLQFTTGQILKVHRVVLNLCTEYFANLESSLSVYGLKDNLLALPKEFEYHAMVSIVKFFYTGKLEVKGSQFNDAYKLVKLMNITILIKLLEAHVKKPVQKESSMVRPIVFKQGVEISRPMQVSKGQIHHISSNTSPNITFTSRPKGALPPGAKTKTVLARVQPKSSILGSSKAAILQKKLPIWKERRFNQNSVSDLLTLKQERMKKDEPPRPTRFEWNDPDEETLNSITSSSSTSSNYYTTTNTATEKPKPVSSLKRSEDIFDVVKHAVKRSLPSTSTIANTTTTNSTRTDEPVPKLVKLNENAEPETSNTINENTEGNVTFETVEVHASGETPPPDSGASSSDQETSVTIEVAHDESSREDLGVKATPLIGISTPTTSTTTSILQKEHSVKKHVRFADQVEVKQLPPPAASTSTPKQNQITISTNGGDAISNHSKIISEVLKKYPELASKNKNIKLKIVQKGQEGTPTTKENKSKVSYIVLKSTSSPDTPGSLVPKRQPGGTKGGSFWDTSPKKSISAENVQGPWLCVTCGSEEEPLQLESYYIYRRHLVEVHGEKIDSRICEYCGQKTAKRNLLLYHQYTKHGIQPPPNCVFPHCDRCDYVALSEVLLSKHKQAHDQNKEYACTICNASFKTNGALQGHMAANLHRNKDTKAYECPYCRKTFVRNINIKAHIRSAHKDIARSEEMDLRLEAEDSTTSVTSAQLEEEPQTLSNNELASSHLHSQEGPSVSLLTASDGSTIEILHHGIDPMQMNLVPSSEAEALTNVANSIAASLSIQQQDGGPQPSIVTGIDGSGQAVYIMDGGIQAASGVDLNMGSVSVVQGMNPPDGTIIQLDPSQIEGGGQFIVQDGNLRKLTSGIDEQGRQVLFLQLNDANGTTQVVTAHPHSFEQLGQGQIIHQHPAYNLITTTDETHPVSVQTTTFNVVPSDHLYMDSQKWPVMTVASSESSVLEGGQQVILTTNAEVEGERQMIDLVRMEPQQMTSDEHGQNVHGQVQEEVEHEEEEGMDEESQVQNNNTTPVQIVGGEIEESEELNAEAPEDTKGEDAENDQQDVEQETLDPTQDMAEGIEHQEEVEQVQENEKETLPVALADEENEEENEEGELQISESEDKSRVTEEEKEIRHEGEGEMEVVQEESSEDVEMKSDTVPEEIPQDETKSTTENRDMEETQVIPTSSEIEINADSEQETQEI